MSQKSPVLALTPLSPADAPRLAEYRAIPRVARYQGWAPGCVDDALRFIASLAPRLDEPGTWFQFGIRLAESGVLVGDLGVHFPADLPGQAELGFTLAPEHQHRGYATEAVQAILAHLFGPLAKHRVFGSVDPRNAASIAVLQRVGMRQEAHFRQALFLKGEWVDDLVFAILQSEWKARD
jgi:RimJ/RimL family protein N-acetyltransferase